MTYILVIRWNSCYLGCFGASYVLFPYRFSQRLRDLTLEIVIQANL